MLSNFTSFDKMITPTIIKILFYIGVAASIIFALGIMFKGGFAVLLGLIWLVLGPVMVRVYCELLIVMFKVHESLIAIRRNTSNAE